MSKSFSRQSTNLYLPSVGKFAIIPDVPVKGPDWGIDDYIRIRASCKYGQYAAVAQLDRVPDSDSGGRGFESRQPYHSINPYLIQCVR